MESKPWLMPVLLKERTCRELWRAGGKPVPSSRPPRLPLGMGGSLLCPDSKLAECCGVYSKGLCLAQYLAMSPACRKVNSSPDIRQLWWARLEDSGAWDQ